MRNPERKQLRRLSVNFNALVVALTIFVIGTALTAGFVPRSQGVALYTVVMGVLGTTLIAISLVTLLWEIFMRRSFLREVLAEVDISENIRDSGLHRIDTAFMDVDWGTFYTNARNIRLCIFHATHTLTSNLRHIESALRSQTRFEVILPNYEDDQLLGRLAKMEGDADKTPIREKIKEAAGRFSRLASEAGSVTVRFSPDVHPFAIYLSDKTAILVLNREPTFRKPLVLVCGSEGNLYHYASEQYASIQKDSFVKELADARRPSNPAAPADQKALLPGR